MHISEALIQQTAEYLEKLEDPQAQLLAQQLRFVLDVNSVQRHSEEGGVYNVNPPASGLSNHH